MNLSKRKLAYLALLLTSLIWGVAVVVIKYTLNFIEPLDFLFWRFLISTAVLLPFFLSLVKTSSFSKKDFLKLFLLGALSTTITLYLLFWGMKYTTAIDVSLISILGPVLIVFGGAYLLNEKVTRRERLGLSLAICGALIAILEPLLKRNTHPQALFGNGLVFLSYLTWTAYVILYKKESFKYHPLVVTFFNFFAGLLTLAPIFLIRNLAIGQLAITINPAALPGILYMSLFSSCIAYFTYNLGVASIEASEATLFDYLKPIFTAPLAFFWLKEEITLPYLVGAVIAAIGVVLSEWR